MALRLWLISILATLVIDARFVPAPVAAAPTPAPSPDSALQCPVRVLDVAPLSSHDSLASHEYIVAFETPGFAPGRLSGTLALFSGARRYDIPFHNVVAAGSVASTLPEATPVLVRFPTAVSIDAAYVSQLGGPDGGPCSVAYVWMKPAHVMLGATGTIFAGFEDDLRKHAATTDPVDAGDGTTQPKTGCANPMERPQVITAAAPASASHDTSGFYIVEVSLSETGSVVDAWLWGATATSKQGVADALVQDARKSTYSAASFRCRKIPSVVFAENNFGSK